MSIKTSSPKSCVTLDEVIDSEELALTDSNKTSGDRCKNVTSRFSSHRAAVLTTSESSIAFTDLSAASTTSVY